MFFSNHNWNNGQEMNSVIPVSSALSFEKVHSSLQAADELYLTPVFGSALMATFEALYSGSVSVGFPDGASPASLLRLHR